MAEQAQLVLGLAGMYVGSLFGMPNVGWAIGSSIGAAIAGSKRGAGGSNSPAELRTPKVEYGARIPRFYGRMRTAGMIPWQSDVRAIPHEQDSGGKGGGGGSSTTFYTYEVDVLYQLCIDSNVVALTRVWYQGQLEWSVLTESDGSSLAASQVTDKWAAIEFFDGNPEQLPWTVYETAVGIDNAIGYRGRATVGITALQCGPQGELPLLEFEVITAGTAAQVLRTAYVLDVTDDVNASGAPPFGNIGAGTAVHATTNGYHGNYQNTINYGTFASVGEAKAAALDQFPTVGNYGSAHNRIRIGPPFIVDEAETIVSGTLIVRTIQYELPLACDPAGGGYGSCQATDPDYSFHAEVIVTSDIEPHARFTLNTDEFSVSAAKFLATEEDTSQNLQGRVLYGSSDSAFTAVIFTNLRIKASYGAGAEAVYLFGAGLFNNREATYAVRGAVVYFMHAGFEVQTIFKFPKAGGTVSLVGPALGYYATSLAANDSTVYVLRLPTSTIYAYDATSLAQTDSFATPASPQGNDRLFCDAAGALWMWIDGNVYRRDAAAWTLVYDVAGVTKDHVRHSPQWIDGVLYITASQSLGGNAYRETAYAISDTVTVGPVYLADILRAEYLRCSPIVESDFDLSELEDIEVTGYAAMSSARTVTEHSMAIYYFEQCCSDKIYNHLRGGAAEVVVPWKYTGAGVDQASEPFCGLKRDDDMGIPVEYSLTYPNVLSDYENGTETSSRIVGVGAEVRQVSTGFVLTPAEAKGRAIAMTMSARVESHGATVRLPNRYAAQQPTSVVTLIDAEGTQYRVRCVRETYEAGVKALETVLDDPGVLVLTGTTNLNYLPAITVRPLGATEMVVLDIPILRDEDNSPGLYTAVKGASSSRWTGAVIRKSSDGVVFENAATHTTAATFGPTSSSLAAGTLYIWDEASTVTVDLGDGTLSSSTREAMQADLRVNVAALGVHGRWELLRFRSAALVSPGVYLLSGLLRGLYGTEWAVGTHQSNDTFVLLDASLRRVPMAAGDLGLVRNFKAVTNGRNDSSALSQAITFAGVGLEPYSPNNLRTERDVTTGGTTLTWSRRTRLATRYGGPGGSVIPLGEDTEAYDVDLFSPASVLLSTQRVSQEMALLTSGLGAGLQVEVSANSLRLVGTVLCGLSEDIDIGNGEIRTFNATTLVGIAVDVLGGESRQLADDGTYAFVAVVNGSNPSYLYRYDLASIATPAATYTGALNADVQGVAYDGTDIWISEFYSARLRKLNKTTLVASASYPITGAPRRMVHDSGSIWVCLAATSEVLQFNVAGGTETKRIATSVIPIDVLVASGILFVATGSTIETFNASTGAPIANVAVGSVFNARPAHLALLGSYVVGADPLADELVFFTSAGAFSHRFAIASLRGVAGSNGSTLFATSSPTSAYSTDAYTQGTSDGFARVYQVSALAGRGYPAEIDLG